MLAPVVDKGLGNSAYLVDLGDRRALAVDASLDLRAVRAEAERRGLTIAFAADTHLHADFLSGALQLAETDGAQVLASAAGQRTFDHVGLSDGDEVDLGGLTLRALATPGHTGEHLAFEVLDGSKPLGVFSGGSLIVGGAARTDLAGSEKTEALSRAQYRSLRRLLELPDETPVWPTHGAGSFCSAPGNDERTTTIGRERSSNPLLAAPDEETFVKELLGGLGSFPPYFLDLPEENRTGRAVAGAPTVPGLDAARVAKLAHLGALVVDVRPVRDFAAGHIPGALSIPLRAQFVSWLGWLLKPSTPYVVIRRPDQDLAELVWQAVKIGYEAPVGELSGGMTAWDGPTTQTPLLSASEIGSSRVLDVRQDNEFYNGHLPDALHVELGDLPDHVAEMPDEPLVVMCGHGERAMTAASILRRHGHAGVRVLEGGVDDWTAATGRSLA
jgi:glyoxylase-like metal-dependent hydrolase (beta-lactamase superfamily II)/rhodanese-related sulfurtransferase